MAGEVREGRRRLLREVARAVVDGDTDLLAQYVERALARGLRPDVILEEGLVRGMNVVSERYRVDEIWIPDVLLSSRAMQVGLKILGPHLRSRQQQRGRILIGTVAGDIHDIGKNLVALMLESHGFQVRDLGVDVPPERFVEECAAYRPDIVALSCLLTTTLPALRETVKTINARWGGGRVLTLVGGLPVTVDFASRIGATAYALDARQGVDVALRLVGQPP